MFPHTYSGIDAVRHVRQVLGPTYTGHNCILFAQRMHETKDKGGENKTKHGNVS